MRPHLLRLAIALLTLLVGLTAVIFCKPSSRRTQTPAMPLPVRRQGGLSLLPITSSYEYGVHDFMDIVILPDGEMWSAGYDGHDPQKVLHSTDGGLRWQPRSVPTGGFTLHSIDFINQHGWAVGSSNVLVRTSDGGKTWEQVRLSRKITGGTKVAFANEEVGYVAAETGYSLGRGTDERTFGIMLLRTADGGRAWRKCYEDDESGNIHMLTAVSGRLVLAAIDGSFVLRTEDAGKTWEKIRLPSGGVSSIRAKGDGTLWAVGHGGGFYYSEDRGRSWRRPANFPPSLTKRTWWDIGFIDSQLGLAVGDHGAFAITTDGGTTWAEHPVNVDDHLRGVRSFGRGGLVLGALNVYRLVAYDSQ